jgi:hypothetical protein
MVPFATSVQCLKRSVTVVDRPLQTGSPEITIQDLLIRPPLLRHCQAMLLDKSIEWKSFIGGVQRQCIDVSKRTKSQCSRLYVPMRLHHVGRSHVISLTLRCVSILPSFFLFLSNSAPSPPGLSLAYF